MKKFVSLALALVMVLALGVAVSAAAVSTNVVGDTSKVVNVTVADGAEAVHTYGATITWDVPTLTYTTAGVGTWSTTEHAYVGGDAATWSADVDGKVTVQNDSDLSIWVEVSVANAGNGTAAIALTDTESELTAWNADAATDAKEVTFTVSGAPAATGAIGTITVTILDAATPELQ